MPAGKKAATREMVRAWLTTVIGPMVDALQIEARKFEGRTNWTFRAGMEDFEFLLPIFGMVAPHFQANREQFFRYDGQVERACVRHDEALASLRDATRSAFRLVLLSPRFLALAAPVADRDRRYLAEYWVNGVENLPDTIYGCGSDTAQRAGFS